jgi:prepilin peptidase CpaA
MAGANILLLVCVLFTAVAAFCDFRTGHIPNRLIVTGLVVALVLQLCVRVLLARSPDTGAGAALGAALLNVVLGIVVCSIVPFVLYRLEAIGGGDVKLLMVLGAFAGPLLGLEIELYSFIVVALYAPARLAYEGRLFRMLTNSALILANPFMPKEKRRPVGPELLTSLRFGPAVFVAAAVVCAMRWVVQR